MGKATVKANELQTCLEHLDASRGARFFSLESDKEYSGVEEIKSTLQTVDPEKNPYVRIDQDKNEIIQLFFKDVRITGKLDLSNLDFRSLTFEPVTIEELVINGRKSKNGVINILKNSSIESFTISNSTFNQINMHNSEIRDWSITNTEISNMFKISTSLIHGLFHFENIILHPPQEQSAYKVEQCIGSNNAQLILENFTLKNSGDFQLNQLKNLEKFAVNSFDCQYDSRVSINACDMNGFETDCLGIEKFHFSDCSNYPISKASLCRTYATFRKNGLCNNDKWGKRKGNIAKEQKSLYISLREEAKKKGNKQLEDDFYYCQMHWDLEERFKLWAWLYRFFCCFGSSWRRPLFWFIVTAVAFSLLYTHLLNGSVDPIALSISASFPLGNIYSHFDKGVQITSPLLFSYFFQKTVQLFFLFEVGTAIRNKVKK